MFPGVLDDVTQDERPRGGPGALVGSRKLNPPDTQSAAALVSRRQGGVPSRLFYRRCPRSGPGDAYSELQGGPGDRAGLTEIVATPTLRRTVAPAGGDVRADVLIVTALTLEYDAVLRVDAGAVDGSAWVEHAGPNGLRYAVRPFASASGAGRPLRVAVVCAVDMAGQAAANVVLPLLEQLRPWVIGMAGVCAGKPRKTNLGDVIAADRVYAHDTGKRIGTIGADETVARTVLQDLTTFNLRPDWKGDKYSNG